MRRRGMQAANGRTWARMLGMVTLSLALASVTACGKDEPEAAAAPSADKDEEAEEADPKATADKDEADKDEAAKGGSEAKRSVKTAGAPEEVEAADDGEGAALNPAEKRRQDRERRIAELKKRNEERRKERLARLKERTAARTGGAEPAAAAPAARAAKDEGEEAADDEGEDGAGDEEGEEAAKEAAPMPAVAAPAAPAAPAAAAVDVLDIDRYLTVADVRRVTGSRTLAAVGPLSGIEPGPRYNSVYFAPPVRSNFGAALQVWRESTRREANERYRRMRRDYPNAEDTSLLGPKSFFSSFNDIMTVAFADLTKRIVVSVSCSQGTCTPEKLVQLAKAVRDRI